MYNLVFNLISNFNSQLKTSKPGYYVQGPDCDRAPFTHVKRRNSLKKSEFESLEFFYIKRSGSTDSCESQ